MAVKEPMKVSDESSGDYRGFWMFWMISIAMEHYSLGVTRSNADIAFDQKEWFSEEGKMLLIY